MESVMLTIGFLDDFFNDLAGLAGALLDAADEFILFAFGDVEIVIGEGAPFLFQFAFGDVPVSFDFLGLHSFDYLVLNCEPTVGCAMVGCGSHLSDDMP
jgi:hypothetical protein